MTSMFFFFAVCIVFVNRWIVSLVR